MRCSAGHEVQLDGDADVELARASRRRCGGRRAGPRGGSGRSARRTRRSRWRCSRPRRPGSRGDAGSPMPRRESVRSSRTRRRARSSTRSSGRKPLPSLVSLRLDDHADDRRGPSSGSTSRCRSPRRRGRACRAREPGDGGAGLAARGSRGARRTRSPLASWLSGCVGSSDIWHGFLRLLTADSVAARGFAHVVSQNLHLGCAVSSRSSLVRTQPLRATSGREAPRAAPAAGRPDSRVARRRARRAGFRHGLGRQSRDAGALLDDLQQRRVVLVAVPRSTAAASTSAASSAAGNEAPAASSASRQWRTSFSMCAVLKSVE